MRNSQGLDCNENRQVVSQLGRQTDCRTDKLKDRHTGRQQTGRSCRREVNAARKTCFGMHVEETGVLTYLTYSHPRTHRIYALKTQPIVPGRVSKSSNIFIPRLVKVDFPVHSPLYDDPVSAVCCRVTQSLDAIGQGHFLAGRCGGLAGPTSCRAAGLA